MKKFAAAILILAVSPTALPQSASPTNPRNQQIIGSLKPQCTAQREAALDTITGSNTPQGRQANGLQVDAYTDAQMTYDPQLLVERNIPELSQKAAAEPVNAPQYRYFQCLLIARVQQLAGRTPGVLRPAYEDGSTFGTTATAILVADLHQYCLAEKDAASDSDDSNVRDRTEIYERAYVTAVALSESAARARRDEYWTPPARLPPSAKYVGCIYDARLKQIARLRNGTLIPPSNNYSVTQGGTLITGAEPGTSRAALNGIGSGGASGGGSSPRPANGTVLDPAVAADSSLTLTALDQNLGMAIPARTNCIRIYWITAPLPQSAANNQTDHYLELTKAFTFGNNAGRDRKVLVAVNECDALVHVFARSCGEVRMLHSSSGYQDVIQPFAAGELAGIRMEQDNQTLVSGVQLAKGQHAFLASSYIFEESNRSDSKMRAQRSHPAQVIYGAWDAAALRAVQPVGAAYQTMTRKVNAIRVEQAILVGRTKQLWNSPNDSRVASDPTAAQAIEIRQCSLVDMAKVWAATK